MEEKKEIKINLDPNLYALNNVQVNMSEESFNFLLISGQQAKQYSASPKHAKRIHLLLAKLISQYEEKFGQIKTELPERREGGQDTSMGFRP